MGIFLKREIGIYSRFETMVASCRPIRLMQVLGEQMQTLARRRLTRHTMQAQLDAREAIRFDTLAEPLIRVQKERTLHARSFASSPDNRTISTSLLPRA
jgi:hypothetical protein